MWACTEEKYSLYTIVCYSKLTFLGAVLPRLAYTLTSIPKKNDPDVSGIQKILTFVVGINVLKTQVYYRLGILYIYIDSLHMI